MYDIKKEETDEFTIYQTAKPDAGYLLELNGQDIAWDTSLAETHKHIKSIAKAKGLAGAGVTEAFGRNRQFAITPRFGYKRIKGA